MADEPQDPTEEAPSALRRYGPWIVAGVICGAALSVAMHYLSKPCPCHEASPEATATEVAAASAALATPDDGAKPPGWFPLPGPVEHEEEPQP